MSDENTEALRTPLGREKLLGEHDKRLDALESDVKDIKGKESSRDKRWDLVLRTVLTIAAGIIIAVVSALIATGVHL